ncbi:MAG: N-acetyltransferase [Cyanobacteriota bacterium erpe_2018_sw_39hr_WHONDRS-SW48-000098_B_bin.30]|nr:N-acetyltransferase [Cyanobacteriota bacterium erpe_2018_sw_39hr_WHONDRS-SW48-000098_B_bin.30]
MSFVPSVTLSGESVELVPLSYDHVDDLTESVRDGELWQLWYTFIPEPDKVRDEIERRLKLQEEGTMMPFSVIDKNTGRACGMTTFMNIDGNARRVEIGSTWYRKSVQRTSLNT